MDMWKSPGPPDTPVGWSGGSGIPTKSTPVIYLRLMGRGAKISKLKTSGPPPLYILPVCVRLRKRSFYRTKICVCTIYYKKPNYELIINLPLTHFVRTHKELIHLLTFYYSS